MNQPFEFCKARDICILANSAWGYLLNFCNTDPPTLATSLYKTSGKEIKSTMEGENIRCYTPCSLNGSTGLVCTDDWYMLKVNACTAVFFLVLKTSFGLDVIKQGRQFLFIKSPFKTWNETLGLFCCFRTEISEGWKFWKWRLNSKNGNFQVRIMWTFVNTDV